MEQKNILIDEKERERLLLLASARKLAQRRQREQVTRLARARYYHQNKR